MEKKAVNQKSPIDKRLIGAAIPVGALRSKNGMGVGEFADLGAFALLCKKMRISLIQLLPVNDTGFDSSPYSSLTAFGLHPMYIKIDDLDEIKKTDHSILKLIKDAKKQAENDAKTNNSISHNKILAEKLRICRSIFDFYKIDIEKNAEQGSLSEWIKQNSWVKEYSVYRRLKNLNNEKSWKDWEEHSVITLGEIENLWNDKDLLNEHLFWAWLQYSLDIQFKKAAKAVSDAGIILKGDLPILMNEDSCDVWAHPEIFIKELSAGAPPDMYSPDGQNWGFPIYNWEAQEKDNYSWWKTRLAIAAKYYKAYRIDHVLGFFRIWASVREDNSSALGRFVPYVPVTANALKKIGYDRGRIRWVSQPHIPTNEIFDALKNNWGGVYSDAEIKKAADKIFSQALERINNEELWLFKKEIKGEKQIEKMELHPAVHNYIMGQWHNRIFIEYEKGKFSPVWLYRNSRAYNSLSSREKQELDDLLQEKRIKSEKIWEMQAGKLLAMLKNSAGMLPCAEDLGVVPPCVPKILSKLKIFSLKVVRWNHKWDIDGQPYVPFDEYPQLSVCTPAVHDSSTVREWWEREADQTEFCGFIGVPSLSKMYNPGTAKIIISKIAGSRSKFRIFQIQDLLHLSNKWYDPDPVKERINVPGTYNDKNWTYRLPAEINEIAKDKELINSVKELSRIKAVKKS